MGLIIKGSVATGLGKGSSFLSMQEYSHQFLEQLGIDPFQGTLNVKVDEEYVEGLDLLRPDNGIRINGFEKDGKGFGSVFSFHAKIRGQICAVIFPEKSTRKGVMEVIAKDNLRNSLGLKDGDPVTVEIEI